MADRRSLFPARNSLKDKMRVATAPSSRRMSTIDPHLPTLPYKDAGNNIKVAVRIRPMNEVEAVSTTQQLEQGKAELLQVTGHNTLMFGDAKEVAAFDFVFGPEATQKEVFDSIGLPMVEDVFCGYNSTLFTYGQTGSGKTFSMMGTNIYDEGHKGIIPRAASELFSRIEMMDTDGEFTLKCSMVEIYKERLNDLLNPEIVPLRIKEDPRRGIYVEGLKQVCVSNEEELMETIYLGEQMRTVASTQWNAVSSRSHQIFLLEVRQTLPDDTEKRGILNLVDLAGSEKVTYHGVTGNKLQETKKINLSLSALGNVIHSLTSNADHIPYRDSKLTRLLQESLGGNFRTAVLVAASPCSRMIDETINSIKFAQRAKKITNNARVNIKESAEMYLKVIAQLRSELATALRENEWLRAQLGPNVAIPTAFRRTNIVPATPSPYSSTKEGLSECSFEQLRLETTPTPVVHSSRRVNSIFEVQLDTVENESYAKTPSHKRTKTLEMESFPLFTHSGRTSGEMQHAVDLRNADFGVQAESIVKDFRKKSKKDGKFEAENEGLRSRIEELEEKLQSLLLKLAKSEAAVHELREANERLKLQQQSQSAELNILREKEQSAHQLMGEMKKDLLSVEGKCKEISDLKAGLKDPTVQEFAEYREVDTVEEPEMEQDEDLLTVAYLSTKTPVDFLCISSYTQSLQQVLSTNSSISREMRTFSLNSGLLAAAMINCGLAAVLHTLAWRSETWKRKYALAKHRTEHQKCTIQLLESAIDTLHDSYVHLVKRFEKMDAGGHRVKAATSITREGKRTVTRFVKRGKGKPTQETEKSLSLDRNTFMSYIEGESADLSIARSRAGDTTLSLQKMYTEQLKHSLDETRAELAQMEKLTQAMEKSLLEKCRNERDSWSKCVLHLKSVYECELIRKHEEVVKLHEVLGSWVQRYLDSQPGGDFPGDIPASPAPQFRPSTSLKLALSAVSKLQSSPSGLIEARSGDSSPLEEDSA